MAYPQDPTSVRSILALMPEQLADTILVQFLDGRRQDLCHVQALKVSVPRLRDAFAWLVRHNHLFLDETRAELIGVPGDGKAYEARLGQRLEEVLTAYGKSVESVSQPGVPVEVLEAAVAAMQEEVNTTLDHVVPEEPSVQVFV